MKISTQFIRYAVVGFSANGALYVMYLALTWAGLGYKLAMTLLYIAGIVLTFLFNRGWTFQHSGAVGRAMARHWAAYGFGYVVNFFALFVLVDYLHLPHEIVQGVMILTVAVMLFLLQRYWVFCPATRAL